MKRSYFEQSPTDPVGLLDAKRAFGAQLLEDHAMGNLITAHLPSGSEGMETVIEPWRYKIEGGPDCYGLRIVCSDQRGNVATQLPPVHVRILEHLPDGTWSAVHLREALRRTASERRGVADAVHSLNDGDPNRGGLDKLTIGVARGFRQDCFEFENQFAPGGVVLDTVSGTFELAAAVDPRQAVPAGRPEGF